MTSKYSMKKYMRGALILTIAAIIVKLLSAIYRVPFQNLVGDKGFYVYQQVYPFVAFFIIWTGSGLSVAISKMVAQSSMVEEKTRIRNTALTFLSICALLFFCVLYFGSDYFAEIMGDKYLSPLLQTGAFVILFMPVIAVLKGFLQGEGNMTTVATSQVFEQSLRISMILIGSFIMMKTTGSIYDAGQMAILGTVIGEVGCLVMLMLYYLRRKNIENYRIITPLLDKEIIKNLIFYSVTVSMSGLLLICYQLIDSFTIYSILTSQGLHASDAMSIKGIYDRGQLFVQLGLVIASSLAMAIVPLVAFKSAKEKGTEMPFVQLTYKVTLIFGVAAGVGLVIVMPYVNVMLFETDALSSVVSLYVLQIIPISLVLTLTAILQGYSKVFIPFLLLISSIGIKLIGNYVLIPRYEVLGAAMASLAASIIVATYLIWYLRLFNKKSFAPIKFYGQLIIATVSMVLVVYSVQWMSHVIIGQDFSRGLTVLWTFIYILFGATVFLFIIVKYQMLSVREWFLIPFGRRMAAFQLWLHQK